MAKDHPAEQAPGSGIKGERTRDALAGYCDAVTSGKQFQTASEQVDRFIADDEARQAYVTWSHLQAQLDERRRRGFELTAGEVHAFESARGAAVENPVVTEYLEATKVLTAIKESTIEWLDKAFELKRSPTDADWKAEAKLRVKEAKDS
jgi:cell fate (sporulation/competence/biofilm development) regulator YlbF (YheA/YmcA/DUF963 family)